MLKNTSAGPILPKRKQLLCDSSIKVLRFISYKLQHTENLVMFGWDKTLVAINA